MKQSTFMLIKLILFALFLINPLIMFGQSQISKKEPKFTSKPILNVKYIQNSQIFEVHLKNTTQNTITYFTAFGLEYVKIEIYDEADKLVEKKKPKKFNNNIIEVVEGSWQINKLQSNKTVLLKKLNIANIYDLPKGKYKIIVKKNVTIEKMKEPVQIESMPLIIRVK